MVTVQQSQLEALYAPYPKHPEGKYTISLSDAQQLYALVRERKPKVAIEYGLALGAASMTIALGIKDNGLGHLITLEDDQKLLELSINVFPEELKQYVSFIQAPTIVREAGEKKLNCYDYTYSGEPVDFVHVDGPPEEAGVSLSGDLLGIIPSLSKGAIVVVDGRIMSAQLYEFLLGHLFTKHSSAKFTTVLEYKGA